MEKTYYHVNNQFFVCEEEGRSITICITSDGASMTCSRYPSFKAGSVRQPITADQFDEVKEKALELLKPLTEDLTKSKIIEAARKELPQPPMLQDIRRKITVCAIDQSGHMDVVTENGRKGLQQMNIPITEYEVEFKLKGIWEVENIERR